MIRHLLCLLALATPLHADLPPAAADLKFRRDAKVAELNRTYAAELAKLQKRAMEDGNLTAANQIQKEIESVTPDPFKDDPPPADALVGKWLWIVKGPKAKSVTREFTKTHMIDERGDKHPYQIKDRILIIDWGRGTWEKATLDSNQPRTLSGANHAEVKFTYERL